MSGEIDTETTETTSQAQHRPAMTTTPLGMEVPVQEPVWREHTAERWKEREPESYAQCCALIRTGMVNQSELARIFGKSRNSIQALMMSDEFSTGEIQGIIKKAALIGTAQLQDKMMELTDKARATKDLGGIAMSLTTMNNINQLNQGGPTQIKRIECRFSVEDFEAERERRRRLSEGGPVVDVVDLAQPVKVMVNEKDQATRGA